MDPNHSPAAALGLPVVSTGRALDLLDEHWGVRGTLTPLPGDRDRNFLVSDSGEGRWVLKVAWDRGGAAEDLELQDRVLERLHREWPDPPAPFQEAVGGLARFEDPEGHPLLARLVTYLPGTLLAETRFRPDSLFRDLGRTLGRLDRVLAGLPEDLGNQVLDWDLRRGTEVVRRHLDLVSDLGRRAALERVLAEVEPFLEDVGRRLPQTLIHGDANDHNVLVGWGADPEVHPRISGLIDFGDMVRSWRAGEVAVAGAYAILDCPDPLPVLEALVGGYQEALPLSEEELDAVVPLLRLRLAVSVSMSAFQSRLRPDDAYVRVSEAPAWRALERMQAIPGALARAHVRRAAGLSPSPAGAVLTRWLESLGTRATQDTLPGEGADPSHGEGLPAPVLPDFPRASLVTLDLTPGSLDLASLSDDASGSDQTRVIFGRMESAGAEVGIGRYDEPRRWYASPIFLTEGNDGPEWRTVHMGIDLFASAGTPVHAPLEATIRSVQVNAGPLDYGPTVILEHPARGDRPGFFTLYGHLSLESIQGLEPGARLEPGEPFARLGHEEENGGWAPHLHFQAIADLMGMEGDVPGVVRPRDREVWRSLCPNPSPLLGLPVADPPGEIARSPDELGRYRVRHLGPNLSVSYREPLKIVRGRGQYLFDHLGRRFLDGVNNVAHVGHANPEVVSAEARQAAVLNTNTRYLHDELVAYVRDLLVTLPEPLRVVYLVCSGSEANELALRLARAHTARRHLLALEAGYHGNTTLLVEASGYKCNGPGGSGPGEWVRLAPLPDPYRGKHRGGRPGEPGLEAVGSLYAAEVRALVDEGASEGRPVGAFLAESLPGCGGQIVLPPGYLEEVYRAVREGGGVCIADEVQVGFGRVGTHFWGFQTQGVVPDIVTMGKPIGNGHPLGAVVTTEEIAASFDNGMEYFNTFGGNPVSCAVGRAVLRVLREEDLQEHARRVGRATKAALHQVGGNHATVGDVRGMGLYLGVELVADPEARTPAPARASYVVNRLREMGILLSTDGPDHNVLKIKPPLPFSEEDGERLAACLDRVLAEEPARRLDG